MIFHCTMQSLRFVATMPCTLKKKCIMNADQDMLLHFNRSQHSWSFLYKGFFGCLEKRAEKKTSRFQTATSRKFVDPETTWTRNIHRKPLILNSFSVFANYTGWKIQDRQYKMKPTYCFWHTLSFLGWKIFVVHIFTQSMVIVFTFSSMNFYPDCKWSIGYIGQDSPKGDLDPSNQQPAGSH